MRGKAGSFAGRPGLTSLLMKFNGTNGSTTFADSSIHAHVITANGGAQISTAQSKFGGASALFASQDDYLTAPTSERFGMGTEDFTIEFWTRLVSQTPSNSFVSLGEFSNGILLTEENVYISGSEQIWNASGNAFATGVWYHVALTRASGTMRVFVDGVSKYEATETADAGAEHDLMIGQAQHVIGSAFQNFDRLDGYMDELRIIKGWAAYTANFTPPTAPF